MSTSAALNRYKTVRASTSSPGELLNMLFDGIFKFLDEAIEATDINDRARAGDRISRAHAILTELAASLRKDAAPELCDNLEAVYFFCMTRLVEANIHRDAARIREVERILDPIRESFRLASAEVAKSGLGVALSVVDGARR
ncbi:MAG: flagellar export chaperone FliS [Polyangiaceae bacterium]